MPANPAEPDRLAGIVLAQRNKDQSNEYYSENEESTSKQSSSASPSDLAKEKDISGESLSALPPEPFEELPHLPEIALPGLPGIVFDASSGDKLTRSPQLTIGRRPIVLPGLDDAAILAEDAAQKRPTGPTGPTAAVSLFGSDTAKGHSFVFVVDRSQSMGSAGLGGLAAVEKELASQLLLLQSNHRFGIIAYHQNPVYFQKKGLVSATEENRTAAGKFFKSLAAFGGTRHEIALLAALRLQPDVIFLFTDGGDPYLTDGQIERIRRRAKGRTSIFCVQFGFGPLQEENPFMRRLSERNGGSFGYVDMSKRHRENR